MKRVLDLSLAGMLLVVMAPLLIAISWMLIVSMGRPVLFRQTRPGLGGRPFEMFKFRTMTDARDDSGNLLPDEKRLNALGRSIRLSSLDELPELWNVLRGDMSFVGPRPLLMEYLPLYSPEQARRHEVRPGITGWAQVNGRNAVGWPERLAMDVWYVDNRSFWLDCRILWMTVWVVFSRKGVSQAGHATMSKFEGNDK